MSEKMHFQSVSLEQTKDIGKQIQSMLPIPACVYFEGDLGSGKTTLSQSIISSFGVTETVTSPTYNLIHEYAYSEGVIYHLDLYRINDPSELEFLALYDLWNETSIFLIEWPNKGQGFLQPPTHKINIDKLSSDQRSIVVSQL